MSNAVLKKLPARSSGVLSLRTPQGWAETIQAFIPAPGTTKDRLLRKTARTVFKTWLPWEEVFPGFWVEGYFLWRNFILLPKKENENIAPGRQRSRVKILPFSHQLWCGQLGLPHRPRASPQGPGEVGGDPPACVPPALLMRLPCEQGSFEGKTVRAAGCQLLLK